jgi:hypothetical protein
MIKARNRCRAFATEGGLCFFPADSNKAAELGRVGGSKKRPAITLSGLQTVFLFTGKLVTRNYLFLTSIYTDDPVDECSGFFANKPS